MEELGGGIRDISSVILLHDSTFSLVLHGHGMVFVLQWQMREYCEKGKSSFSEEVQLLRGMTCTEKY